MPELNSIDDFFRRKEEESSANNNDMSTHWDQMNELMKDPTVTSVKGTKFIGARKFMLYAAAAVILIIIGVLVFSEKNKVGSHDQVTTKTNTDQKQETTIPSIKDSIPQLASSQKNISVNTIVKKEIKQVKTKTEKNYTTKKETTITEIVTSTITKPEENKIDNAKTFTAFFKELEKPAQEFTVNTARDTVILSKEGTKLTIPSNAFVNEMGQLIKGTVKIYLQEFYDFADIVGNKLTTMSNEKPLATGGMFNIVAKAEEKQVKISPQHPLTLTVPTRNYDPFMQLFTGQQVERAVDTIREEKLLTEFSGTRTAAGINWTSAGQPQYSMINTSTKEITILNLRDNPYDISYGKKVIGRFEIPYDSKLTKEEMKAELQKRYSKWYDVIKVKKQWRPWRKKNRVPTKEDWYETVQVGDSIVISLRLATKFKMITREDSLGYEAEYKRQYEIALKQENSWSEWIKKKNEYSFTITNLGWINCDRFLNYPERKLTDFVLNPGNEFSESYLYSVLIFTNANSIMPGQWINGKIVFQRIPLNEMVSLVSIGVKDGKTWACVQPYFVQKEEINKMLFEETSPEQLKRKLSRFGDVGRVN